MKLSLLLPVVALSLGGCINIKAPENLVSDTIKAGEDLYHSVKGDASRNGQANHVKVFSYSYEILENESLNVSKNNCVDTVIKEARKSLNQYNLDVKKTEYSLEILDGKDVIKCSVSI